MNNHQNTLARISEIINKSSTGVVIIPPNPTNDALAAATSLYLGLNMLGKNVTLSCASPVQSDLFASDKVKNTIAPGGDSLMISFPYSDGSIDKVDYNIQGNFFNLVITPRAGFTKLNPQQVNYSYTGGTADFIFVVDAPTLNSLGAIYSENQPLFVGCDIINVDRHLTNAFFGTVNFVNKTASSVSELALNVLTSLNVKIDRDIATNLYFGVASATNNFTSYSVSAETFENIANLLRFGAVKKMVKKPLVNNPPIMQSPIKPNINKTVSANGPEFPSVTPIEQVEKEKQPKDQKFEGKNPSDMLRPKIFRNSGLI